jgi:hypothetical protein
MRSIRRQIRHRESNRFPRNPSDAETPRRCLGLYRLCRSYELNGNSGFSGPSAFWPARQGFSFPERRRWAGQVRLRTDRTKREAGSSASGNGNQTDIEGAESGVVRRADCSREPIDQSRSALRTRAPSRFTQTRRLLMGAHCWPVLVSALLGAGPVATVPVPAPTAYVTETAAAPYEPRFYFDCPQPWLHGYIQEVSPYAGYHSFRPYNYKQVFAQSQIAAGWGLSPMSPYSQQYWHRDHAPAVSGDVPQSAPTAGLPAPAWQPQPSTPR